MATVRVLWADGSEAVAEDIAAAERMAATRDPLAPAPVRIEPSGSNAYWIAWCPACSRRLRIPAGVDDRTGVEVDPRDWTAEEIARACPVCGEGPSHIVPIPTRHRAHG